MSSLSPLLLVLTIAAVGVLHTLVPDHWAPIALLARQQGWPRRTAVRTAAMAGAGHTISTLAIAAIVWLAGIAIARQFGDVITAVSAAALVAFGAYISIAALLELRSEGDPAHHGHMHWHSHGDLTHRHWHEHPEPDRHAAEGNLNLASEPPIGFAPVHAHTHPRQSVRTALLLILGSSPMIEGIPLFLAASRYGVVQLATMSAVFAVATIGTYVALVTLSLQGLENVSLGRFERYGEVISGTTVALVGIVFFFISR